MAVFVGALRRAGFVFWLRAAGWTVLVGLAIGVPTVLIENSLFKRMTPTSPWQYVAWVVAAPLIGLTLAARSLPGARCRVEGKALTGGGLAYLAVGCPICNKIVVLLLGISGTLQYFAPLQPLLAVLSVAILIAALRSVVASAGLSDVADTPTQVTTSNTRDFGERVLIDEQS
jgi:hypothetical protein